MSKKNHWGHLVWVAALRGATLGQPEGRGGMHNGAEHKKGGKTDERQRGRIAPCLRCLMARVSVAGWRAGRQKQGRQRENAVKVTRRLS